MSPSGLILESQHHAHILSVDIATDWQCEIRHASRSHDVLTSNGTLHLQKIGFLGQQLCSAAEDKKRLLLCQPPFSQKVDPQEIEIWFDRPMAILYEKLFVRRLHHSRHWNARNLSLDESR